MVLAQIGQVAPPFSCTAVVDGKLKEVSLKAYTDAHHWLILIFFPKAWSFICPTEIKAFSSRLEEFLYTRACAVLFASTDNEFTLKAWNATGEGEGGLGGVHVPLLSDSNHTLSRSFGVLNEAEGIAQRGLFVIDPTGTIRAVTVYDADVGRSVDEAQRLLDALKFRDEHNQGCPADWRLGDKGVDVVTHARVEGPIDVNVNRVGWTDWALPKVMRNASTASSATNSSRSNGRVMTSGYPASLRKESSASQAEMDGQEYAELLAKRSGLNSPGAMSPSQNGQGTRRDSATDQGPNGSYFKPSQVKESQPLPAQNPPNAFVR